MSFARALRRQAAREASRPPRPVSAPSTRSKGRRLTTTIPAGHLATPRRVKRHNGIA